MTTPKITELPVLQCEEDVLERVATLIGPAIRDRQLWVMFVDGDGRQAPVMMPISDMPVRPDPGTTRGLAEVLGGLRADLVTANGAGSVVLVLERLGVDDELPGDRVWARSLTEACTTGEVRSGGLFLSTPGGVRPLRAP